MTNPIRLKGLMIALVALSLSAGAAFASSSGLTTAAGASGKTVPVNVQPETTGSDEDASETPDQPETKPTTDTQDATAPTTPNDNCATSPVGMTTEQLAGMTHGQVVCWAAHQTTPDGFANHGAWVKSWATFGKTNAPNAHAAAGLSHKGQGQSNKP